jgi:hypothetical protein
MPHAFKPSPDHPAVAYLVRLHADLGGKIWENKKEAERLAESMRCVEAVIRLFDPAYDVRRITARRRYKGNVWFKRGTIMRHVLETLRTAHKPLTAREIAVALLVERGARDDATPKALRNLTGAVQVSLVNHEGKTVARVGEGMPGRWRLSREKALDKPH